MKYNAIGNFFLTNLSGILNHSTQGKFTFPTTEFLFRGTQIHFSGIDNKKFPLVLHCIPELCTILASLGWTATSSSPRALAITVKLWEKTCKPNYDRDRDRIGMKFQADDGLEVKRLGMKWERKRPWWHDEQFSFLMFGTVRWTTPSMIHGKQARLATIGVLVIKKVI